MSALPAIERTSARPSTCAPNVTLGGAERLLALPVLPPDPFAGQITACNRLVLERLTGWAEASRASATASLGRLRSRAADAPAEDWELAALGTAAREWRVFEAFRALHERARCPGLLFRLQSRTDFLTLCDRRADSSPSGYGERQRRVLAKRGIVCRRSWVAARALVAEVELLDDPVPPAARDDSRAGAPPPDAPTATGPDEGGDEGEEPGLASEAAPAPDTGLPALVYRPVWHSLGTLPKARLAAVIEEYGVGLWAQFGGRFYSSMRKPEMLEHARRVVRHHAALDAAQRLSDPEIERLYDWMRGRLGADAARSAGSADLHVATRLFKDFLAAAALSAGGLGLSPRAWNRYRDAELRRIGAFCYGAFYEEACGDEVGPRAQVSAAEAP